MGYVEFLRARRALFVYSWIVALVLLCVVVSVRAAHVQKSSSGTQVTVNSRDAGGAHGSEAATNALRHVVVPFAALVGLATYGAMIFAVLLGSSLNKENDRGGFAFTKPISREHLALTDFAVDGAAIVLAFCVTLAGAVVAVAGIGLFRNMVFVGSQVVVVAVLGLGIAAMWYGLLQAVTAGMRSGGGRIGGFSVAVFAVLLTLPAISFLGPVFHALVVALNLFNPLAYMTGVAGSGRSGETSIGSVFALPAELRAAITWCAAVASCAVAIAAWKRVEA